MTGIICFANNLNCTISPIYNGIGTSLIDFQIGSGIANVIELERHRAIELHRALNALSYINISNSVAGV